MADAEAETTTVRDLERELVQLNDEGGKLVLLVDTGTNYRNLLDVIVRDTKDSPPFPSTTWRIEWVGEGEYEDWTSLINLIRAMGRHHLATKLQVDLPFKRGHLTELARVMKSEDTSLEGFQINDMEVTESTIISGEEAEKEIIGFLREICLWQDDLIELEMTTRFSLDPSLLEKMADLLPSMSLEQLSMEFNEPPQYDPTDQSYKERMAQAYKKLRDGLEPNHSLQQMGLWVHSDYNSPLNTMLSKLFDENLEFLLSLNASGRGDIITMPLHRDTWLEIIARYTDDDLLDGEYDPDAVYYYLRRNTWMFTRGQCLEQEIKSLQDEVRACKKRHQEEMEAKEKQHQEEIKGKDLEIQRLRAELLAANDQQNKRRKKG